jgi:hypothetical protein
VFPYSILVPDYAASQRPVSVDMSKLRFVDFSTATAEANVACKIHLLRVVIMG